MQATTQHTGNDECTECKGVCKFKPKPKIYVPEDPGEANLCDSCQ